ncbi:histidine phosphatase family protein [bacterium]|nr:histidine phosphatase family protein [bacterium]
MTNDITDRLARGGGMFALCAILCSLFALGPASARLPEYEEPIRAVYLIRHGEYDQEDERDPDVGRALVGLGYAQARLVAARLVASGTAFTSIQASTMTRARQTGEVVAACLPGLELELHRDIRECTPTTRRADIMEREDPAEVAECEATLAAAWARIFTPAGDADAHDVVVCHGNVIRWFVTRALEVDPEAWLGMSIANCSLTVIQVKPDGACKLVAFADAGHIPSHMQTYPGTTIEGADNVDW